MKKYQIDNVIYKKDGVELIINNKSFLIDSFYYECIMPYKNKEIDEKQMEEIATFAYLFTSLKKLYAKVFANKLSLYEFKALLKKDENTEENINIVTKRLIKEHLLDDEKYAMCVLEKFSYNKGVNYFKNYLISKHVDNSIIERLSLTYKENIDYVLSYANTYIKNKSTSNKMIKQSLFISLSNKGFSNETIDYVINKVTFKNEEDSLIKDIKKYQIKYKNEPYKVISKLLNKGYNINDIKKNMKDEVIEYED
ncbi:MAG: RecX family transcriptional regulator [Erysipelotrichaceae bacterium]|nr:RecX family transcriptional regulator [Erysipelotrichaceae bacterium]